MAKDMLGTVVRKIVDLPAEMLGAICDLGDKLSGEAGQEWFHEFKKFLRKEKCWTDSVVKQFLKLISGGETIIIDAVDGTETLADAKDVFGHIDSDLESWGTNKKGLATAEVPVNVYEMEKDATHAQMFGSLVEDARKLCFTQAQIKAFAKKHRNWLRTDGYATFFLFESNGEFFVAYVLVIDDGSLKVSVFRFERSDVWSAERRHRVVVPQLAA